MKKKELHIVVGCGDSREDNSVLDEARKQLKEENEKSRLISMILIGRTKKEVTAIKSKFEPTLWYPL